MTKCPYVPPMSSMSIFRISCCAIGRRNASAGQAEGWRELAKTDRNGKLAALWRRSRIGLRRSKSAGSRRLMEQVADVHRDAELPKFHGKTFAIGEAHR